MVGTILSFGRYISEQSRKLMALTFQGNILLIVVNSILETLRW